MFPPGYYKTNYRRLRFGELKRKYGLPRALRTYWITRFKPADNGIWMPGLWAGMECPPEALSEEFRLATKPHQLDFERLGFTICRYAKTTRNLNPFIRDSGGISYLDPTRRCFGQLLFIRRYSPSTAQEINTIAIVFTAGFENGTLNCTNHQGLLDPLDENEVIRLAPCDVNSIYQRFQEELKKRPETPRHFPDLESLRQWFDARQVKTFEERARRRLFIPMTNQEVETAQARLASGTPPKLTTPPRLKFPYALWLIVILGYAALRSLHSHSSGTAATFTGNDTIVYQGQRFKMRKAYTSYEDYKDDPDNLNPNDLDRLEHAITTAKIPVSFKTRQEFVRALFDLKFPGYGLGGIGASVQTDDGSTLDIESVEIPQRDKERYLVAQGSAGQLTLVDDFVYGPSTDAIAHVKLEKQTLRYYDSKNSLLREKQL